MAELESLHASDARLGNRIADAEALLAGGRLEEAEAALGDLRTLARDRALDGIRQLSRIMAAQAEVAFLRGDLDSAFREISAAADLFDVPAPQEGAALRDRWADRFYQHGLRQGGPGLAHSAALLARNLDFFDRNEHPRDWGATQNALGNALQQRGIRTAGPDGTRLLAHAAESYVAALEILTREDMPAQWATTQKNLGEAFRERGTRTAREDGTSLLARAIEAYTAALEVLTRKDMPAQWAMTQENIAIAYRDWARRDGADLAELLARALAAVDLALEVYDPAHMSHDHGTATRLREKILGLMAGA